MKSFLPFSLLLIAMSAAAAAATDPRRYHHHSIIANSPDDEESPLRQHRGQEEESPFDMVNDLDSWTEESIFGHQQQQNMELSELRQDVKSDKKKTMQRRGLGGGGVEEHELEGSLLDSYTAHRYQ
eukprot:CAMPEP_0183785870 /NCGR_PEP_ID=MMETSP0739-20130205/66717_1 /TAXON_ID=385413 /ORGANISM="Thalassiosira miniscula, Strain CCMP1093" /LENGTH=125 /DNA_ID=CAMNT_0026029891 /DNA_START=222 /DNA_END=600 /DNA_ORIENTATION=+